ncbi:hypothetical protein AX14_000090 [Amanita brunnescens Koide BX004]|nr:hypothetical protein AX14_000090 [Amanita brunnescens Koide BX004]
MSSNPPQAARPRPPARKKPNDDAAYTGPSAAALAAAGGGAQATKRQATDRAEGEPRNKRKKVETIVSNQNRPLIDPMSEPRTSLVEFNKLSVAELHRYLTQFNIVPIVRPSPLLVDDPPAPITLANPTRAVLRETSPGISMPANRSRREGRRRSSRLADDESERTAVLADVEEVHTVLAGIAERHFRETLSISGREEVDTLASFMCAVEKAKAMRVRAFQF